MESLSFNGVKTVYLKLRNWNALCAADTAGRDKVVGNYKRIRWVIIVKQSGMPFRNLNCSLDIHARCTVWSCPELALGTNHRHHDGGDPRSCPAARPFIPNTKVFRRVVQQVQGEF